MKISWASTVVVIICKETHTRPWVNWEISEANEQGKRIVGVFEQGGRNEDIPSNLEKYASAIVGWNAASIQKAVDGSDNIFQNPDGSARDQVNNSSTSVC